MIASAHRPRQLPTMAPSVRNEDRERGLPAYCTKWSLPQQTPPPAPLNTKVTQYWKIQLCFCYLYFPVANSLSHGSHDSTASRWTNAIRLAIEGREKIATLLRGQQ